MSGSHYEPDPSQRYSLEDTMHDLPAVTLHGDGRVLSAANLAAAAYRVPRIYLAGGELHVEHLQVDACIDGHDKPPAVEPNCTVWTDTVDRRLAALEAKVAALLARLEDGK